jgi:carbamoyl-phosphate synthase small subunit
MTYPLIGNYGINKADVESRGLFLEGFVMKECSKFASNWRSRKSLPDYLKENNIPGIEGIDTRSLTLLIREKGAMKAVLSTLDQDTDNLIKKAKNSAGLSGLDLVKEVTINKKYTLSSAFKLKVALLDCGAKQNILRSLIKRGCAVTVFPAGTPSAEILDTKPHGLLLSNGPGDPVAVKYCIKTVRELIGKLPIFGICLGHQILGLAFGAKTFKLKFGHHGANHPVKDINNGKVYITSQNHGFCVDISSLSKELEITHLNLNDKTMEGMRHRKLPVFSVQFHPEASPGPRESEYLFDHFIDLMKKNAKT